MNYRILVESVKENVEVRLVDSKGNSLPKAESLKLLAIVRSNLSYTCRCVSRRPAVGAKVLQQL